MKNSIVYILGSGSKWNNNEIRYSLRSIEKKFENHERIFIIGRCPGWAERSLITHIPADDIYDNKLKNAVYKISLACQDKRISEEFILMNDDFIFLRKTPEIKTYTRGALLSAEETHQTRSGYYFKAINNTRKILRDLCVKTEINFEIHYPMIFEKKNFLKMIGLIDFKSQGLLFRSIYGNLFEVKGLLRSDFKLYDISELEDLKKGEFISTDNRVVFEPEFQKWIKRKFNQKSKYERVKKALYYAKESFSYNGRRYNPGDAVEEELPEAVKINLRKA